MTFATKMGVLLTAALFNSAVFAAVYSYRDADGNLVFTDEPVDGELAVEVEVVAPMSVPAFSVGVSSDLPRVGSVVRAPAELLPPTVSIVSPLDGQALWSGNGEVPLAIDVSPGLAAGQVIAVLIDGDVVTRSGAGELVLPGVDRGTHSLEIEVQSDTGVAIARSESITIHVHRPSIISSSTRLMHPSVQQTRHPVSVSAASAGN